jgi:putative addiction module antidote
MPAVVLTRKSRGNSDQAALNIGFQALKRLKGLARLQRCYNICNMETLTVRKVGNSLGATFPKEVVATLDVHEGDRLFLVRVPDGYMLTPFDPEFEEQMAIAREIMHEDRDILRELAKR